MTSRIKRAQYCNLIQQPKVIIKYFKDYEPNKFLFGLKWTMFYNAALGTMQGNVPNILL